MIEIISTTAAMNATSDYPFDDIFPDDDETTTAGNGTSLVVNWMVKFIPSILLYSVIFIVGFVGNIVVILSICYLKKLHTITNMFIVSLSLADLLLIIICVPIKVSNNKKTTKTTNYFFYRSIKQYTLQQQKNN